MSQRCPIVVFDEIVVGVQERLPVASAKEADTDHNIYHCVGNPELSQSVLKTAKQEGIDTHSLATDPLFMDPANGDFRLKSNSPALKLGIVPIDVSKIGLRGDP